MMREFPKDYRLAAEGARDRGRTRISRRKIASIPILLLALLLAIAACSPPPQPIRIGLLEWPPYEILRLADRGGYLAEANVEIVEYESPTEVARAYQAGGLDIVALSAYSALELYRFDNDHRIILVIDESQGGDAIVSREPLPSLADAAGLRVGLEPNGIALLILQRMLAAAGLETGDVELVYLDVPDQRQAFTDGRVDLLVTYEPLRSELLDEGHYAVFSSLDMPGDIIDVFVTRQSLLDREPERLRWFARSWFRALDQCRRDLPACAAQLAPRFDMSAREYVDALSGARLVPLDENYELLDADASKLAERLENIAGLLNIDGHDGGALDLTELPTATVLPEPGALD